jgi:hypothetical protein
MPTRIDIAISKALSAKLYVQDAGNPLDMLATSPTIHGAALPPTLHGAAFAPTIHGAAHLHAAGAAALPPTIHGAAALHITTIHGAAVLNLPKPQHVSRVEIVQRPNGELIVTLHE